MAAYLVLVFSAIYHHEPWADEAQAWLLARDASTWELWTKLLHYEGSPGLWQTLLHVLIRLGFPYASFSYFPTIFASLAAWLILKHSPFPLAVRLILPFSFFLGYQYVVVARSYDLLPFIVFALAVIYSRPESYTWTTVGLLCAMSLLSAHALILSACIAFSFGIFQWKTLSSPGRRRFVWGGIVFLLAGGLCSVTAFPAHDVAFVSKMKFSLGNMWEFSSFTVREAFTGEGKSTCLVLGISLPFLWRGRGLVVFVTSCVVVCVFGAVVYAAVWHQGILLLAWLFALWISADRQRKAVPRKHDKVYEALAMSALASVALVQCYWTVKSVSYDWKYPYSAGRSAAGFLLNSKIASEDLCGVGYATTAVQPYFPKGPFRGGTTYWDWSNSNPANNPGRVFASGCRYVLVGYKTRRDRDDWATLTQLIGYHPVEHFEGNLFWKTKTLEAESFDLYRLNDRDNQRLKPSSTIQMNDTSTAAQLISGFYRLEANAWRWTGKDFSVLLRTPDEAKSNGATITIKVFVSEKQIKELGTITLRASIGSKELAPRTFSRAGVFDYSADIPADQAHKPIIWIKYGLDKSTGPSPMDPRELGLVVTSIRADAKKPHKTNR